MKRQALNVTVVQLRKIADELEKELKEIYKEIDVDYPAYSAEHVQMHTINIINDEGLSDTWYIEEDSDYINFTNNGGKK